MSWSVSEILKPLKTLAVVSGLKTRGESFEKKKIRVSELVRAVHGMIQMQGKGPIYQFKIYV